MTTRAEIRSTVLEYLADAVDDLDPDLIDTARSMKDTGAKSLDIDELVDRLHEVSRARASHE